MAAFTVRLDIDAPARDTWRLVTDWPAHGRWVPLTRVSVTRDAGGVGTRFLGRTGVGPVGFDDPMEVVRWEPPRNDDPGTCTIRKRGRVVLGWVEIVVRPVPGGRSQLLWTEDLDLAPVALTGWASPVIAPLARLAYRGTLMRMRRELTRGRPAGEPRD